MNGGDAYRLKLWLKIENLYAKYLPPPQPALIQETQQA